MWIQRFLISCALVAVTLSAHAFDRPFPQTAKRGVMKLAPYPAVIIDDKMRRLSAAARIWNQSNLIQVPASLSGDQFIVNYTQDMQGDIDRIWILTDDEAKKPPPKATPPVTTLPSPS
jgi:hypothetical protein